MMFLRLVWTTFLVALPGFSQNEPQITREGDYWVQKTSGSIPLKGSRRLRVFAPGVVRIKGESTPNIAYTVRESVRARAIDEARRYLAKSRLSSGAWGAWTQVKLHATEFQAMPELTIVVPTDLEQIEVNGQTGDIELHSLEADVTAELQAGMILVDAVMGALSARTGGGEIRLGKVAGSIRCVSGGGSIRVEQSAGESYLETAGGGIHIGEAKGPVKAATLGGNIYVDHAWSTVWARTSEGVVQVKKAGGKVVAETAAGSIEISNALDAQCKSATGAIRLMGIAGTFHATTATGNITAELAAGPREAESVLNTGFGDITVLIPSNLSMTVKATSVPAGVSGTIISEFPEIRVRKAGISGYGPVLADGWLNGGGPVLDLTATGGTVYLRRRP
jgi:hypothetical protein